MFLKMLLTSHYFSAFNSKYVRVYYSAFHKAIQAYSVAFVDNAIRLQI